MTATKEPLDMSQKVLMALIYGVVQAILAIPVMYGYAAIVFSDPIYQPFMPSLAKLMLFSSTVHSISFCALSTIPFAIGLVQDAGLIFLSKIATDIAIRLEGDRPEAIVATSLVIIAVGTTALGLVLVLIGRAKLAKFVAFLPMPVIGGYLGFIGFFCVEAGLSLASGKVVNGMETWHNIMNDRSVVLCLPAMLTGGMLTYVSRKFKHFAALPAAIAIIPISFYLILFLSGHSLDDARDFGWLGKLTQPADFVSVFKLYSFSDVHWEVLPFQLPIWLAMTIVVAFSSCLDVAAIEMDMGSALNTNAELITVGVSNVFSGIFGGFTGSYIFSQTIFGFRTGFHFRSVAIVMIILEIAVFLITIDPLSFIPLFFFAATLIFIGIDLMLEWLLEVKEKLSWGEYIIVLVTFVSINVIGLNPGLLFGVFCSVINFVGTYALYNSSRTAPEQVRRLYRRSITLHHPNQEKILDKLSGAIVTLELHGTIFFLSSTVVLAKIMKHLNIPDSSDRTESPSSTSSLSASQVELSPLIGKATHQSYCDDPESHTSRGRPQYLILDCSRLQGIDATAARSAFLQLQNTTSLHNITLCYAGCTAKVSCFLKAHGALVESNNCMEFRNLNFALDWAETQLLNSHFDTQQESFATERDEAENMNNRDLGFTKLSKGRKSMRTTAELTVSLIIRTALGLDEGNSSDLEHIRDYNSPLVLTKNEFLFSAGEMADEFYVLLEGELILSLNKDLGSTTSHGLIINKGSFIGYGDVMLERPRSFYAQANSRCVLAVFNNIDINRLEREQTSAYSKMLQVILKQCAREVHNDGLFK